MRCKKKQSFETAKCEKLINATNSYKTLSPFDECETVLDERDYVIEHNGYESSLLSLRSARQKKKRDRRLCVFTQNTLYLNCL